MSIEKLIEANTSAIKELTAAVKALTEAKTPASIAQAAETVSAAVEQSAPVVEEVSDVAQHVIDVLCEHLPEADDLSKPAPTCTYDEAFATAVEYARKHGQAKTITLIKSFGFNKLGEIDKADELTFGKIRAAMAGELE